VWYERELFLCCLDNWECSLCLCVVFWFCFLLIMDIRNPLEEMVLKIFLLDIISIRSLSTSQVSSTDRMFFFSLYDQAPFCFHVTLFFLLWSHAFFFFHRCIIGNTLFFYSFFSCSCYIIHPSVIVNGISIVVWQC